MPNGWGQNKNIPDSWGKNNKLPDNWGKQSTSPDSKNNSGASPSETNAKTNSESSTGLSDKAKSGVGMLAGVAKKVGGAAKNVAGSAVEYAKSDKAKERLNAAKNKARSLADGAGSKLTDIKEKTSDKINEHRQSRAEADVSENNITEDTVVTDTCEDVTPEAVEFADDIVASDAEASADTEYEDISADEQVISDVPFDDTPVDDALIHEDTVTEEEQNDEYYEEEQPHDTPVEKKTYDDNHDLHKTDESSYAEDNDSRTLIKNILIGAVVLAVGIGAIIGIGCLFQKSESKKTDTVQPTEMVDAKDTTETDVTNMPETTMTATAATSASNVTTAETTTKPPVTRVDTSAAVNRALKAHFDRKYEEKKNNPSDYFDKDAVYALYDVNADGIDELFIRYNTVASNCTDIYIYKNDDYTLAESIGDGGVSVSLTDNFIMAQQYGGGRYTRIFNVDDGRLVKIDELCMENLSYTHNGASISETAYNQMMSQYESKNLKHIYETGSYCSGLVDVSGYKEIKNYSVYDTSAAGRDFDFYSSSKSATVNVTSGGLNLRSTPEFDGDIIVMMAKGAEVIDYGSNNIWAYVRYIEGSKTYFGYASKQYLDYHENVTVYSCNRYGRIRLNSGELRGFKRSYVVDGGTPEEYDVYLQDGWHIKAVNYCVSKGITWYELYDADDGDYYGWIDSAFIAFD